MKTYLALLRGINVSGQKKIKMADLRELLASLNYHQLQTYIQSGNILFKSPEKDAIVFEEEIGQKIKESYGFDVPVMVIELGEWEKAYQATPFTPDEAELKYYHLTRLSDIPLEEKKEGLDVYATQHEEFVIQGRWIYMYAPSGYGKSKLSNNFFENKLKVKATTRNWKTVRKLLEMGQEL